MEWLDLNPFDVLHGRDEFGDAFDIRRIVSLAWHQCEANPRGLADRREAFGKPQGGGQIAARDLAIGIRI